MTGTRRVSARMAALPVGELARFGIAGLVATACYFILANSFAHLLALPPQYASVLAYALSVVVSYLLQSRFTFARSSAPGQMRRFALASAFGLFLSFAIVKVAEDFLHWPLVVASLIVCVAIPVSNYLLMKVWVFK
jgi:putative flippase GtrA